MTQNAKDIWTYGVATLMIVTGVVLSFVSFLTLHLIHSSILIYLSEALTFFGSVYGLALHFKTEIGEFESKIVKKIDEKFAAQQQEKTLNDVPDRVPEGNVDGVYFQRNPDASEGD